MKPVVEDSFLESTTVEVDQQGNGPLVDENSASW